MSDVWPFRRRNRSGPRPVPPSVRSGGPAGWRGLPPIQRAVPTAPLTVGVWSFETGLATRRRPELVGPLEHAVSADTPAGIAWGLATALPVQRAGAGELALPAAPRPRTAGTASRAGAAQPEPPTTIGPQPAPAAPMGEDVRPGGIEDAQVEVEGPVTVVAAPARPLTTAPPPPLPTLQLSPLPPRAPTVQQPAAEPEQPPSTTEPEHGPVDRRQHDSGDEPTVEVPPLMASSPAASAPEPGGLQRAADAPAAAPDPDGPARRLPSWTPPPRRLGLGAPLPSRPAGLPARPSVAPPTHEHHAAAPVDRSAQAPTAASIPLGSTAPMPDLQRTPVGPGPGPVVGTPLAGPPSLAGSGPDPRPAEAQAEITAQPPEPPGPADRPVTPAPEPRELGPQEPRAPGTGGRVPVQRSVGDTASAPVPPGPAVPLISATPAAGVSPEAAEGGGPEVPVDSWAPLLGVQRAPEAVPTRLREALEPIVGSTEVRVHRDQRAERTAERLQARAFTAGGDIHLPARQGSLEVPPGRALLAHELVHVAQQRRLGATRPAEHTASGQELEREAVAVERAVAGQGNPGRPIDLPLATPPVPAGDAPIATEILDPRSTALATGAASLDADGAVVFSPPGGVGGAPALQRAPEAAPVVSAPPEPPPAPAGAPGGDLDELARRLYDRIRVRLKAELRLDRERSGHLTDLRH